MTLNGIASTEHKLQGALLRLDLRLRLAVEAQREDLTERARDPFRGMYITDSDVDTLLAAMPVAEAARRYLDGPASAAAPRLERLARLFALDDFEQDTLLICLAPDLDLRYERLYAYLQDDVTRRRPTVDLILRLLGRSFESSVKDRTALGPSGRLLREGLLILADDTAAQHPLLARPLRLDERIVEYLIGSDLSDARISAFTSLIQPTDPSYSGIADRTTERIARLIVRSNGDDSEGPVIYIHGAPGTAKLSTLRTSCYLAERPLFVVDVAALLAATKPIPTASLVLANREALLQQAVLAIDGVDRLIGGDEDVLGARNQLRSILTRRSGPTFLIGEARWEPAHWLPGIRAMRIELSALGPSARLKLWRSQLDGLLPADDVVDLAARFRLDGDAIRAVGISARLRADWRDSNDVEPGDFRAAAGAVAAPPLEGLARRVEPRYGWDDIILSPDGLAQLKEFCARAEFMTTVMEHWGFGKKHARRTGLTALFAGQPGTGKTMAAEVVAGGLGLELFRIDLASVVSKYIGETEKNLERIFRAADRGDAVLLFDEADAIFGKRSEVRDAHDRYANVETAYLLQRLEAYDGLAILTTNLRGNIDEAFVRRLDFVLEFPLPEEPERLAIWRLALPAEAPLEGDLDLSFMARKFKLAGGYIRNIALAAAFLAAADRVPIGMKHLVRATRREHQKMGKMLAAADFEQYFRLLKD